MCHESQEMDTGNIGGKVGLEPQQTFVWLVWMNGVEFLV